MQLTVEDGKGIGLKTMRKNTKKGTEKGVAIVVVSRTWDRRKLIGI